MGASPSPWHYNHRTNPSSIPISMLRAVTVSNYEEPVTKEEPVIEEPVIEEPIEYSVEESKEEPVIEEPVTEEPVIEEPIEYCVEESKEEPVIVEEHNPSLMPIELINTTPHFQPHLHEELPRPKYKLQKKKIKKH